MVDVSKRRDKMKLNTTGCHSLSTNRIPNEGKYNWKTLIELTLNFNYCN